jgi:hypothetical protein
MPTITGTSPTTTPRRADRRGVVLADRRHPQRPNRRHLQRRATGRRGGKAGRDADEWEFHLRRVCARLPKTISPAGARRLARLLDLAADYRQD